MRALCCWTDLRPDTEGAVRFLWPDTHEFVDCRSHETRYHETLERYWQAGADFVNVEHDVVPDERVRDAFEECEEPWCVFVYELAVGFLPDVLGCVRFRTALMQAEPDAMVEAGKADQSGVTARAWYRTDVRLSQLLRRREYSPHLHGRVPHLNEKQKLSDPDAAYRLSLHKHADRVAPNTL